METCGRFHEALIQLQRNNVVPQRNNRVLSRNKVEVGQRKNEMTRNKAAICRNRFDLHRNNMGSLRKQVAKPGNKVWMRRGKVAMQANQGVWSGGELRRGPLTQRLLAAWRGLSASVIAT